MEATVCTLDQVPTGRGNTIMPGFYAEHIRPGGLTRKVFVASIQPSGICQVLDPDGRDPNVPERVRKDELMVELTADFLVGHVVREAELICAPLRPHDRELPITTGKTPDAPDRLVSGDKLGNQEGLMLMPYFYGLWGGQWVYVSAVLDRTFVVRRLDGQFPESKFVALRSEVMCDPLDVTVCTPGELSERIREREQAAADRLERMARMGLTGAAPEEEVADLEEPPDQVIAAMDLEADHLGAELELDSDDTELEEEETEGVNLSL